MTAPRDEFLARLRAGMQGLPQRQIDGALADYGSHFDEGRAAGRDEAQVALALGDPQVLAEQMRLELELASWEASNSPRSGWRVVAASFRRAAATLLPALLGAAAVVITAIAVPVTVCLLVAGIWLGIDGASLEIPGGLPATSLAALGLIAAALSIGATAALAIRSIVNRLAGQVRRRLQIQSRNRSDS